jgi:ABC-type oligopeptide transport system substrate-binding subunit
VPNPNWALSEKPKVEKIVMKYIDDPVINNAYRTGELDAGVADTGQLDKLKTEFPTSSTSTRPRAPSVSSTT